MERKIGEIFKYEGKKIRVEADEDSKCKKCYLNKLCPDINQKITGECVNIHRQDKTSVVFVEINDEQPQEQAEQSQELNLCEILKDCPKGERFWSPLLGDVKLSEVNQRINAVFVTATNLTTWRINHDATITINGGSSQEIMLYPSREQRDWTKVKYEPKKERFNPKTLNPFDKVLVRNVSTDKWGCSLFSNINAGTVNKYHCVGLYYKCCIPYNDETKHLVGTTDEAPDFYKYWED